MFHLVEDIYIVRLCLDLITYSFCFLIFIYILKVKKIKDNYKNIFLICTFTPFFFNNLFFDWTYFLDQSKYLLITQSIRDFQFDHIKNYNISLLLPSVIYALLPSPSIYSFTSISLLSRFFFLITLIFCFKKYLNDKAIIYFFLLCPSIILYTSVGLRETFLFSFLILFFFNLKKNKFYYALIFILLLTITKPELGLMIILSLVAYYIFFSDINSIYKVLFLYLFLMTLAQFNNIFLEYINKRFTGYYQEEFFSYPEIYKSLSDMIIRLPYAFLKFIFSPLFEITNIFKFLQFIENIILYFFIFFYFINCYKKNKLKSLFWLVILLLNLLIYSLVVVNSGSIARYKISLFLFIILSLNYSTKKNV